MKTYPNLTKNQPKAPPSMEEFEEYVERLPWSGCWAWLRGVDHKGYGEFKRMARKRKAHRYAYELYLGSIPTGKFVCHSCDNPACVNPGHLFLGDAVDNVRDCIRKGRRVVGNAKAHLIAGAVKADRQHMTLRELMQKYGVCVHTIYRALQI
jgi:hypothetical protein